MLHILGTALAGFTTGCLTMPPYCCCLLNVDTLDTLSKSLLSDRLYLALSSTSTNHKTLASMHSVSVVANTFLVSVAPNQVSRTIWSV